MLAVKFRKELLEVEEEDLAYKINPVISWSGFELPDGSGDAPKLGGIEGDPGWFFSHTYPTSILRELLKGIHSKLDGRSHGVFPLDGYLGSGKSHTLMAIYHLFQHPTEGNVWLDSWGLDFSIPKDVRVVPLPLQSIYARDAGLLWQPFFKALGFDFPEDPEDWPRVRDLRIATGGTPTILLIDEIDNWYDAKPGEAKARVRGFLQTVTEASEEPDIALSLIITFLSLSKDVKTLRNVVARPRGGSSIVMQRLEDIFSIVKFRLFEEVMEDEADRIISGYLSELKPILEEIGTPLQPELKDELKETYPFHPALLKTLTQLKTRELLVILGVTAKRHQSNDILISKDLDDDLVREYLHSLDPKVVDAYLEDIEFIKNKREVLDGLVPLPLARGVLLSALLSSIGGGKGAPEPELLFGATSGKVNPQDFQETVRFLAQWTRLTRKEDDQLIRYVITTELPPAVHIDRRAELVPYEDGVREVKAYLRRHASSQIDRYRLMYDPEDIENDRSIKLLILMQKPSQGAEIVPQEVTYRNSVVLLYPSHDLAGDEVVRFARRVLACRELRSELPQDGIYKDFLQQYEGDLGRLIQSAGWRLAYSTRKDLPSKPIPTEKSLPNLKAAQEIIEQQGTQTMIRFFVDLVMERTEEISIRELRDRFYRLEGAPLLYDEQGLMKVLSDSVADGAYALKGTQGRIIFRRKVRPLEIGLDDFLTRPREVSPPSKQEVIGLVKEKGRLTFRQLHGRFAFVSEDVLEKMFVTVSKDPDAYVIQDEKVVDEVTDIESAYLVTREEAGRMLEPTILKTVREEAAIYLSDVLAYLRETYLQSGVDKSLIRHVADNLEISQHLVIRRKKEGKRFRLRLELPPEQLHEKVKKGLFHLARDEGEVVQEDLFEQFATKIPADKRVLDVALTSLLEEGKLERDPDSGKLRIPRRGQPPPTQKSLLKFSGLGTAVAEKLFPELGKEDVVEFARLEVNQAINAETLKGVLEALSEVNLELTVRRRPP